MTTFVSQNVYMSIQKLLTTVSVFPLQKVIIRLFCGSWRDSSVAASESPLTCGCASPVTTARLHLYSGQHASTEVTKHSTPSKAECGVIEQSSRKARDKYWITYSHPSSPSVVLSSSLRHSITRWWFCWMNVIANGEKLHDTFHVLFFDYRTRWSIHRVIFSPDVSEPWLIVLVMFPLHLIEV